MVPRKERLTSGNVADMARGCHILVDCLDNLEARLALNRHALEAGLPLVHGGVWGWEGRIALFHPPHTPCLACVYPRSADQEPAPVPQVTPGVAGAIQAAEVLKWILGHGRSGAGRMVVFRLDVLAFHEFALEADPECPVCGPWRAGL